MALTNLQQAAKRRKQNRASLPLKLMLARWMEQIQMARQTLPEEAKRMKQTQAEASTT